jgi:hypothetical protein
MSEEEEEGFSFVDKRRVGAEPSDKNVAAESTPEPPDSDDGGFEEELGSPEQAIPQLSVHDRIFMSIDILHQGAWIALGLRADPATGQIEQDLDAARLAIDCVTHLASKIENSLDEATRRELKRVVSDLQLNYVNQSQRARP